MKSFKEWKENTSTTKYSLNELIETLDSLTPNFSELIVYGVIPEENKKYILDARKHYDEAIKILKNLSYMKNSQGQYIGDIKFNN